MRELRGVSPREPALHFAEADGPAKPSEYIAVFLGFVALYLLFFSPVLVSGGSLAFGDGSVSYLPSVTRDWSLWTDLILAGYPAFADPQFLTWYPLRLLGSHYNALVVSAYVIASFCTYGYARMVSGSRIGALAAGIVYGCSGFMMAHLGHLTIIHSAAWIPLTLWGLELLARDARWRPAALVAAGVALSCLGGHPQPWVYGLVLAGAYAAWRSTTLRERSRIPQWRYLGRVALATATGLAIASIQLLPLVEFSGLTVREQWAYRDFTSYSLPLLQLPTLLFPNLFGNVTGYYHWFGPWSPTEVAFYAGVIPVLLATAAPWSAQTRRLAWFWIGAAVIAVIYMLGGETPLAKLAFHLPVLGHFRVPARAGIIFTFAVAVLASISIGGLQRGSLSGARLRWSLLAAGMMFGGVLLIVWFTYGKVVGSASARGIAMPPFMRNPAVGIPCLFLLIGIGLCLWIAQARSRLPQLILLPVILMDVASFGWFYEWRVAATTSATSAVAGWESIIDSSRQDYGRILPLEGVFSPAGPGRPNENLMFGLASASGYGPLLPLRYADVTGVNTIGKFSTPVADSLIWPLLGVRWLLSTDKTSQIVLGSGCGIDDARTEVRLVLPARTDLAALRIDSHMACSTSLADDAPVFDVLLDDATSPVASLLAGRDSSEWSIDSPSAHGAVRHRRASVIGSFPAGGFSGHWYRGQLDLPMSSIAQALTLRMRAPAGTVIRLRSVTAIDRAGVERPLSLFAGAFGSSRNWRPITPPPGFAVAMEYAAYAGRAWLVGAGEEMNDKLALQTIDNGMLPWRRPFNPLEVALLDGSNAKMPQQLTEWGRAGTVASERLSGDHWRFKTKADRPALLVISQTDYPGWHATVNGRSTPVYRADYAFQAIAVPAGDSEIELRFRPRSLLIGGLLCVAGLLLLVWFACAPQSSKRKRS